MDKDLDRLVAERVMGWHRGNGEAIAGIPGYQTPTHWYTQDGGMAASAVDDAFANMRAWSPSNDIAEAWQVVAHMRRLGYRLILTDDLIGSGKTAMFIGHGKAHSANADSDTLAICRAALRAASGAPI